MELTKNNYFSIEADTEYFSVSQFKDFNKCEAAAMAKLNGIFHPEMTQALLVGSYVDAFFEGELPRFRLEHPEIFKKDGELKAEYKQAEEIIERLQADKVFMQYMTGMPQVIRTGELFGYKWKIKMDSYVPNMRIVDLKVMKDFDPIYIEGQGRTNFIEAWGYDIQGAVYQAIEGNQLPFFIAAATKEKVTDFAIFKIPQDKLDTALKIVEHKIDHIADVKSGLVKPTRCEKCEYCKRTKKLRGPVDIWETL